MHELKTFFHCECWSGIINLQCKISVLFSLHLVVIYVCVMTTRVVFNDVLSSRSFY